MPTIEQGSDGTVWWTMAGCSSGRRVPRKVALRFDDATSEFVVWIIGPPRHSVSSDEGWAVCLDRTVLEPLRNVRCDGLTPDHLTKRAFALTCGPVDVSLAIAQTQSKPPEMAAVVARAEWVAALAAAAPPRQLAVVS